MSHGKDPTPLFEIIHKAPRSAPRAVRVPEWMRRAEEMERQVEVAQPTTPGSASTRPAWLAWWYRPVRFRLQMGILAVAGLTVLAALVVAFLIGTKYEERKIYADDLAWSAADRTLEPLRQQPANTSLIGRSVPRNLPVSESAPAPPRGAGAAGSPADPREPGLNYFRLVTLPASAATEGHRAVSFLQAQGIDAVLLPDNNGRAVKLMALPGFAKPGSPEGKKFEERLKSLGRSWKAQHRGSSDWSDLLAEKYKPDVN
jgi:hypothetical protein